MNTPDDIERWVNSIEQVLLARPLEPVERFVLYQSCLGKKYTEMAEESGYGSHYMKEVGSHLWQDLSQVLGQRVTKKNLLLVLKQIQTHDP